MLKDYRLLPSTPPQSLVILLHGVGANGQDLIGIGDVWRDVLPHTGFISPDAPQAFDMAPFGRQWFSLQDWTPEKMLAGIKDSAPILESYITQLQQEFSLPANKIALMGFSQGTMMALYAGLRHKGLAGILGYSGACLGAENLPADLPRLPICLIHGTADNVVPVDASRSAAALLQKQGYNVDLHLIPGLGHGIDDGGLEKGAAFLRRI